MDRQFPCAAEARVAMPTPRRSLSRLRRHFRHKPPVTLEEAAGRVEFPGGLCALAAGGAVLPLRLAAQDAATLTRRGEVLARHLPRFAFRDLPESRWTPDA